MRALGKVRCGECLRLKGKRTKVRKELDFKKRLHPFQQPSIDYLSLPVVTMRGSKCALFIVCPVSQYLIIVCLRSKAEAPSALR